MGQTPYWMQPDGSPPPPPPKSRSRPPALKIAVSLLAVALIAVSAVAYVGLERTNDLERRLDESEQAQPEEETEPENPVDDLLEDLGGGDLDDLLGDLGGGGDAPLGGANPELLECLSSGQGGGGLDDLFGGGQDGLGDLFGGDPKGGSQSPKKLVDEISKQVEKVRELRFDKAVDAEFISKAQIEKRVGKLFLEDYSKKDADLEARLLEALGAIERDTNLFRTRKSVLEGQVSGFYVPSTEELVVLSGEGIGALEKITLAHELEHALADQNLGLPLAEKSNPAEADSELATLAVIEGDATLTMQRWSLAHLSLGDQLSMLSGSAGLGQSQEDLEAMPHFIQQQLAFPYLDGLAFICEVHRKGDWAAVDKAYDAPPPSTDQVLFPERYDPGAEPVEVSDTGRLSGPWTNALSGSFGAAELKWLFEAPGGDTSRTLEDPLQAVAAWGGGEVDLWTKGESSAVGISLASRDGDTGLCKAVAQWYSASFDDDETSEQGEDTLVAEGGAQDAVITCSDGEVRIGIAPDLDTARSLTG